MGLFPYVGVFFSRFVLFFDKLFALSLLPILFIAFGIDELSKIMLIVIGVTPTIILDTFNLTRSVPREQIVKASRSALAISTLPTVSSFGRSRRAVLNSNPSQPESGHAVSVCRRDDRLHDGLAYRLPCCAGTWEWM